MIFRRFPTTFRRFPKIFQNCPKDQTNVPEHFPKISENFRRCPKITEDFRGRPEDVSMIHQRRDKPDVTEINDIFSCEDIISSHVRISYRFYQFVTTRYTTDFYIIKWHNFGLMYFHFRSMRISFISKVTRVHKAMPVENNTSLCSTILVVFLEFIPVDRTEISHMKTPQNSSR